MYNPLQQPRPDDPVQKIHDYARDLAYLALQSKMSAEIQVGARGWSGDPRYEADNDSPELASFRAKWWESDWFAGPDYGLLASYQYMTICETNAYLLAAPAFALLDKPARKPTVFISYRRKDSSAFALLIEARLRLVGVDSIFIDKHIQAGDTWHDRLETVIAECEQFICLVGPGTLESSVIADEIRAAVAAGSRIISIWHQGQTMDERTPAELRKRHAILVSGESARDYETAISELLNALRLPHLLIAKSEPALY
jgi:hypothetical protein